MAHGSIGEKPLACSPRQGQVNRRSSHNDLEIDEVVCPFASRFACTVQFLSDLMVERHEGQGVGIGKPKLSKHACDIWWKHAFGLVGIAQLIVSDFQRDGAPWFSTVIDLDVEWAHDVLGRHMRRASLAARHESACEAVPSGGKRGLELLRPKASRSLCLARPNLW